MFKNETNKDMVELFLSKRELENVTLLNDDVCKPCLFNPYFGFRN